MSNQENPSKKNPNEIGALWVHQNDRGDFYTGQIEIDGQVLSILVSPNSFKKEGSKQPDWRILKSTRPAVQQPARPAPATAKPAARPTAQSAAQPPRRQAAPPRGNPRVNPAPVQTPEDGPSDSDTDETRTI